uniref:Right handed beta helix domain-containing protein n=1 Tax=Amphora coffeiformis TaxID=265554 RepID=A0A7S3L0V6_9STRA
MPSPGAYAMQLKAPVYVMGEDENDEGEEPFPDEVFEQLPSQAPSTGTMAPAEQGTIPVDHAIGTGDGGNNNDLYGTEAILDAEVQPARNVEIEKDGCFCSGKVLWISIVAAVVVVIVVVVVVVVVAVGGDSNSVPLPPMTLAPTLAPTLSQTLQPTREGCYRTTRSLVNEMSRRNDFTKFVEYTLCPRAEILVDVFSDSDPTAGIFPPIPAQSNVLIKCGDDGSLANRCIIANGNAAVINSFFAFQEQNAQNVTFEGITFERGRRSLLELYNGGDITFRDCVFRSTSGGTPIEVDFQGWDDLPDVRQVVTFERCIFQNLVFGSNNLISGEEYPMLTTLIMATHPKNTLIVRDCVFRNNEIIEFPGSYIASLGAQIQVEKTCFSSSSAGQYLSPILLAGEGDASDYSDGGDNYVGGTWDCTFIGDFIPGPSVTCGTSVADATSCESSNDAVVVFW